MSSTLIDVIAGEFANLLAPILDGIEDPHWFDQLLHQLGTTTADAGAAQLLSAFSAVANLKQQIDSLASAPAPSFAGIAHVLEAAKQAFVALRALSQAGGPAAQFATLGEDLVQYLFGTYLSQFHPFIYSLGVLLTLIDSADQAKFTAAVKTNGNVVRQAVAIPRFHLDRLSKLIQDPEGVLRAEYLNGLATVQDANAMADKLFGRLSYVLGALGVRWLYGFDASTAALLGNAAPFEDHSLVVYFQSAANGATVDAGVTLSLSPADRGDLGLVVCPFGSLSVTGQYGNWTLQGGLTAKVDAFAYGRHGATIIASTGTTEVDAAFSATLAPPPDTQGPAFLLGSANGTRIEIGGADFKFQTGLTLQKQTLGIAADIANSAIVISAGDGDSFVSSVLPSDGLRAGFDLGIAWSNTGGLSFRGGAGLDATFPVGVSIGGVVTIPTVHLALNAGNSGLSIEVSAAFGLNIGPVRALVDRLGFLADITFPDAGGNLGIADLGFAFKAPSGVGLVIDAAGVTGGGFLSYDDAKSEYSGVLQLQFTDLALQAFGLITTQVAGGHGYSLLALIDAEFPPVQLGWGFTLNGVGGILAVNRAASVDALRAALKAGQLGSILFPKNAIANAPLVLAELDKYFPTAPGRFLFGPMALIGWGTPTILTAAVAIIVELPEPIRIILLARISARMPSESGAVVRINMDALGVLDLGKDELSLDATLFDSKILDYTLSGDMALRAAWGAQREFLLAIGGFHPQFTPPAGFPALKRLTIDMPSGSISKMRLAAYLAITSNTVQFGASLDVFIGVSGYGVAGHLSFDALFQWSPFHFTADISGRVALMAGGDDLMSVELKATLTGPGRWNVAGHFKIDLFLFDVSIDFSYSWGHDPDTQTIAAVDVLGLLTAALADARNWGTQLPAGVPKLVSLSDTVSGEALAHPLSRLEVHESVVPLGIQITRIGAAVPSGATTFTITGFSVNASAVSDEDIQDDFAPAQFFDLTDEEKLARPSFESHNAGVRMGAGLVKSGAAVTKTMGYETFYIDTPGATPRPEAAPPSPVLILEIEAVLAIGSAGSALVWKSGNRRYSAPGNPIRIAPQKFAIADASTLAPAAVGAAGGATYTEMKAALAAALARDRTRRGSLQIVSTHELAAA